MTRTEGKTASAAVKDIRLSKPDGLRDVIRAVMQTVFEAETANREGRSASRDFLVGLKARVLKGVELVVSDDRAGPVAAIGVVVPVAEWQRCYVHLLRNALDHLPRKHGDDCVQELRWLYDRRDLAEAKADLAAWLAKWSGKYTRLTGWAEENIERTLTFFRLPRQQHKHLKSTNMLERLNEARCPDQQELDGGQPLHQQDDLREDKTLELRKAA